MNRHIGYTRLFIILAGLLALTGCSADDPGDTPDVGNFASGLKVTARMADYRSTRAYQDSGLVTSGKYTLSYPNTSKNYTTATVDFDKEADVTPGLGIVTTNAGSELKWSDIGGSPVTFYLDNVSADKFGRDMTVEFTPDNNPFKAGLFDFEEGINDLLWGDKSVNTGTKSLGFDLHHYMSRVRVKVSVVHLENSVGEIDLEGATVSITNLYPTPVSYNREDGSLALDTDGPTATVTIVSNENGHNWLSIDKSDPDNVVYTSQDIVLPPQSLAEDENRPRLEIVLADGDIYSGILPHAMLIDTGNGTDITSGYPVTLAFLKEYILTIHTVITEEPPELAFMPVWVRDWVDKGEFTLEAHQSGIYTASEFYKLIDYYNSFNEYQLVRYGYLTTPEDNPASKEKHWLFNFFSSVVLDYKDIFDKMKPGEEVIDKDTNEVKGVTKDFTFSFNNYAVYVQNGDEETMVRVSEQQLYDIVRGNKTWSEIQKQ